MGIGEDHEPMYRFNRQLAPISSAKFFSPRVVRENSRWSHSPISRGRARHPRRAALAECGKSV